MDVVLALVLLTLAFFGAKQSTDFFVSAGLVAVVFWKFSHASYIGDAVRAKQWEAFEAFLNRLHEQFPQTRYEWVIISDNPAFDIAKIDYQRLYYAGVKRSMRHAPGGEYIPISDPTEQIKGFDRDARERVRKTALAQHAPTHDAKDDALYILQLYIEVRRYQGEFMRF
jgi:hypothetical protein